MKYTIEKESISEILLENGDLITAKIVFGSITPIGKNPDESIQYNVQQQICFFVAPKKTGTPGGKAS